MGLVAHQGKWGRPEVIGQEIHNEQAQQGVIRDYLDRRVKADSTPDAQKRLAQWCEQNGLKEQACALQQRDPARSAAGRCLETSGLQEVGQPLAQTGRDRGD